MEILFTVAIIILVIAVVIELIVKFVNWLDKRINRNVDSHMTYLWQKHRRLDDDVRRIRDDVLHLKTPDVPVEKKPVNFITEGGNK